MRFGSVCSGIEAASVAWEPLGWKAAWFSEIEPFPSAVLAHHFPDVPNYGDMTALPERILSGEVEAPDLLCGGTPCQAFSVAGLRKSLDDDRGNLSLIFTEVADAIDSVRTTSGKQPAIIFWENVPGVLNTKDNAFGCFLGQLVGAGAPLTPGAGRWPCAGYVVGAKRKAAWRVLDAQYFGVPQRRRRVFVVASARDGFDPAEILFERPSVSGDSETSGEPGQEPAAGTDGGARGAVEGVVLREDDWGSYAQTETAATVRTANGASENLVTGGARGAVEGAEYWDGGQTCGTLTKCNAGGGQRMPDKGNFTCVVEISGGGSVMPTLDASAYQKLNAQDCNKLVIEQETATYGLDRASFNQGKNAKYNFAVEREIAPTITARGPGAVAQLKEANHDNESL